MVRGDQYTDESDSDWDSLSQAVPPSMAQSVQLGKFLIFDSGSFSSWQLPNLLGEDGHKTEPANEVAVRRTSADSNRSIGAAKGPLTFIDRHLDSPAIQSTRDE